jgi:hypothetical protein
MKLEAYNSGLDGLVRTLQVAGIVPFAAAAIGLWNLWLTSRSAQGWGATLRSAIVALALLGVLWFAWLGNLIGFDLNY